jgi:hypothetical protein
MSRRKKPHPLIALQEERVFMRSDLRHKSSFVRQLGVGIGLLLLLVAPKDAAQNLAVATTPPMGWNSWNHFAGKIDDAPCGRKPTRWFRAECATRGTST